jgi:hypothetical protein
VKLIGFRELHAPFLKERRTRCHVQGRVQEIRGISLVFREMWDTTVLHSKAVDTRDASGVTQGDSFDLIRQKLQLSRKKR